MARKQVVEQRAVKGKPGPKPLIGPSATEQVIQQMAWVKKSGYKLERKPNGNVAVTAWPSGVVAAYLYASRKHPQVALRAFNSVAYSSIPGACPNARFRRLGGKGLMLEITGGSPFDYARALIAHIGDVEREAKARGTL